MAWSRCSASRAGYTLPEAFDDFAHLFDPPPTNVPAVNHIDDNVVFYGGMAAPKKAGGPGQASGRSRSTSRVPTTS